MASCSQVACCVSVLLLSILTLSQSFPAKTIFELPDAEQCGYQSCSKIDPNKLNVHLVPHSHDDVGWLKTVDQYFYGARTDIQRAGVQYIIETVVDALLDNPDRRFVQVETAFFFKWWIQQTEARQQQVKDLVNEGRLEFIGGAWSMNDEAAAHYQSIVDQFTLGLRKLNETFGVCGRPTVGWQIDPFGHTREMASLFAQMGYNGVFFARWDFQDKSHRLDTKTAEMIWEGSPNLGGAADLFTHALYNHYSAPSGFCFDILCNVEPFIDNKRSPDYNVDKKVEDFVNFVKSQASHYTSNNIILTMGDDFNYQDAHMYFRNLDKLVKYVNAASNEVNVMYSTPSCYLKAVNDQGLTYTTKQDDFVPYGSDGSSYWTGFYTSRPTSKRFERMCHNFLQVGKKLEAITKFGQTGESPLDSLRETLGVMQHHDAITGTEKQHVANDYARLMSNSLEEAQKSTEESLRKLMEKQEGGSTTVKYCIQLNVSMCDIPESNDNFVVTVYNPIAREVNQIVRVPVSKATYKIQDAGQKEVQFQVVPVPAPVQQAPERQGTGATHELVFEAAQVPGLGFQSYYVTKVSSDFQEVQPSNDKFIGSEDTVLVQLDEQSGLIKEIAEKGVRNSIDQNLYYYVGATEGRSSGAYIFRPTEREPKPVSTTAKVQVYKGDLVEEIHQEFSDWVSQVIRIYKGQENVEIEWLVGPIPLDGNTGKEIVSRFTSKFATETLFYTDSNGRELLERKRDFRPTWNVDLSEPTAGNYYPITSRIVMRDTKSDNELAVLNDRAQGGSSINDGQLELMLHRRLTQDDGFGVGEALNEEAFGEGLVARGKHYVFAGNRNGPSPNLAARERILATQLVQSPLLFFSPGGSSFNDWSNSHVMNSQGIAKDLPLNVQLLTLEAWNENELLVRLEHILEENEDAELSKPADVDLSQLFGLFDVLEIKEVTLDGNMLIEDKQRLVWNSQNRKTEAKSHQQKDLPIVTLNPMEIRTFIITVKPT